MNGLQGIKDRILTDAKDKADHISDQAQKQCEEILAAAKQEIEQIMVNARQSAAAQAQAIINRACSAAALQSRKTILKARQDMIDKVISRSVELLCQLPDQEKIVFYQQMLQQTQSADGEIVLAAADQRLSSELLAGITGQFTIAAEAGSFAGGLVLRRNLIEDNLTFERLVAINRPQLVRLAAAALAGSTDQNSDG